MKESDIETAFVKLADEFFLRPIKRQVDLPIGIADILCWNYRGTSPETWQLRGLSVVEVKKGKAPDSAVSQVLSYCAAIENEILSYVGNTINSMPSRDWFWFIRPEPIILAERLDKHGEKALDTGLIRFISYRETGHGIEFYEPTESQLREATIDPVIGATIEKWAKS